MLADGEALARRFHEAYERLAPSFGYETRTETRQFDPATPNGRLMIAVCSELASHQQAPQPVVAKEGWSLSDRIEFALRDGGFTEAEAARITANATQPQQPQPELPKSAAIGSKSVDGDVARADAAEAKYHELLLCVGNKYPDESRHETALRYLRRAEQPTDEKACTALAAQGEAGSA